MSFSSWNFRFSIMACIYNNAVLFLQIGKIEKVIGAKAENMY